MGGACGTHMETIKYVGNKSRARHRRRGKDNIKMHFKGIGRKMVSSGSEQRQVTGCFKCGSNFWVLQSARVVFTT